MRADVMLHAGKESVSIAATLPAVLETSLFFFRFLQSECGVVYWNRH